MEFLVLEVEDARFGVPTADVREVLRAASLGAPPSRFPNMTGMLNYRGQVLGVLELERSREQPRDLTPHDHLIILQAATDLFALRVDQAVEILSWDGDDRKGSQDDALKAISHPRLGVVNLLETATLWSELHYEPTTQPTQEVEASQ